MQSLLHISSPRAYIHDANCTSRPDPRRHHNQDSPRTARSRRRGWSIYNKHAHCWYLATHTPLLLILFLICDVNRPPPGGASRGVLHHLSQHHVSPIKIQHDLSRARGPSHAIFPSPSRRIALLSIRKTRFPTPAPAGAQDHKYTYFECDVSSGRECGWVGGGGGER